MKDKVVVSGAVFGFVLLMVVVVLTQTGSDQESASAQPATQTSQQTVQEVEQTTEETVEEAPAAASQQVQAATTNAAPAPVEQPTSAAPAATQPAETPAVSEQPEEISIEPVTDNTPDTRGDAQTGGVLSNPTPVVGTPTTNTNTGQTRN